MSPNGSESTLNRANTGRPHLATAPTSHFQTFIGATKELYAVWLLSSHRIFSPLAISCTAAWSAGRKPLECAQVNFFRYDSLREGKPTPSRQPCPHVPHCGIVRMGNHD